MKNVKLLKSTCSGPPTCMQRCWFLLDLVLSLFNEYKTYNSFNYSKNLCVLWAHPQYMMPLAKPLLRGFKRKPGTTMFGGPELIKAELEMLRHLVADSTKSDRKNWDDCTGKLQGYVGQIPRYQAEAVLLPTDQLVFFVAVWMLRHLDYECEPYDDGFPVRVQMK